MKNFDLSKQKNNGAPANHSGNSGINGRLSANLTYISAKTKLYGETPLDFTNLA